MSGTENFTALANRLGLNPAEMLVITHKLKLGIFDPNYGALELRSDQVDSIVHYVADHPSDEESLADTKSKKRKTRRQQMNVVKAKKRDTQEEDPRSVDEFAEYFNIPKIEILQICEENEFTVSSTNQHLSKKDRRALSTLLYSKKLNVESSDTTESIIPVHEVVKNDSSHSSTGIERATHKRISVLCRELDVSEEDIRFVLDALQIRIVHDRFDKFEVRHEKDIATALTLIGGLPSDRNDRGEIRIKAMAGNYGLTQAQLASLCAEYGIPMRHKRYVSIHGGLRIATLLSDPDVLKKVQTALEEQVKPAEITTTDTVIEIEPVVDYQGISLARQNFKDFSFEGSNMQEVDLSHAILVESNLQRVNATDGNFARIEANKANFAGSLLVRANFDHANLSRGSLVSCNCEGAVFANANLQNADLTGANFTGADMRWVNVNGATFSNTTWINGEVINSQAEAVI